MLKAESDIKTLTTNVRRLILRFTEQKKENAELYAMVDERVISFCFFTLIR